jgi:SAM-dependent methyltransferase
MSVFDYDLWPSRKDVDWGPGAARGDSEWDTIDFHVDLGCGTRPKARIGVDRYAAPGVAVIADLDGTGGPLTYSVAVGPGEDAPESRGHEAGTQAVLLPVYPAALGLPFGTSSIKSIISHHFFEHVGDGFIALVDEMYRVLEPGGVLRAITPLFPSTAAVADPDHRRYFMASTWDSFCGTPDYHWMEDFSVPYSAARFECADVDMTPRSPIEEWWGPRDYREIRVALKAVK